jgi:hypothetical protein
MKARYIDQAEGAPRRVRFAGLSFPLNVFIDVSEIDTKLQGKLRGNPTFEVSDDEITEADEAALKAADTAAMPTGNPHSGDDDDDDADGGSGSADKDALLDELDTLHGKHPDKVKFDRRWGVPKLKQALEDARFAIGDDE